MWDGKPYAAGYRQPPTFPRNNRRTPRPAPPAQERPAPAPRTAAPRKNDPAPARTPTTLPHTNHPAPAPHTNDPPAHNRPITVKSPLGLWATLRFLGEYAVAALPEPPCPSRPARAAVAVSHGRPA